MPRDLKGDLWRKGPSRDQAELLLSKLNLDEMEGDEKRGRECRAGEIATYSLLPYCASGRAFGSWKCL